MDGDLDRGDKDELDIRGEVGFKGAAGARGLIVWSHTLGSEVDLDIVVEPDINGVVGLEGGAGGGGG